MPHQSLLVLRAAAGRGDEVVAFYRRAQPIEVSVPFGVVRGELARLVDDPDLLVVSSLWRSRDAYDAWLVAPERAGLTDDLTPLLDPAVPASTTRVDVDGDATGETPLDLSPVVGDAALERVLVVR